MYTKSQSNPFRVGSNLVSPHKSSDKKRPGPIVTRSSATSCTMHRKTTTRWMQHGLKIRETNVENSKMVGCVLAVGSSGSASSRGSYCSVVVRCCVSFLQFSMLLLLLELYRMLPQNHFFWMASIVPWVIGNDSFLMFFSKEGPHPSYASLQFRTSPEQKTKKRLGRDLQFASQSEKSLKIIEG